MGALLSKIFGAVAGPIIKAVYGIFRQEREDVSRTNAETVEKTVDSVEESLDVEKTIRDKQDEVDKPENKPDVVVKPDETDDKNEVGGLNFDDFNEGK
jgi:hypothetical protein